MRPARKGPENPQVLLGRQAMSAAFNEAGPQGAGKRPRAVSRRTSAWISFNEAGPQGAGKRRRRPGDVEGNAQPSMRPARKGPENTIRAMRARVARGLQ